MHAAVYILCSITSVTCAILLIRAYIRRKTRLLLWCACCFAGLAIDNTLLFVDLVIIPDMSIAIWRNLFSLLGALILLCGIICEDDNQ